METAADYKIKKSDFKEVGDSPKKSGKEKINIDVSTELIEFFDDHYYKIFINNEPIPLVSVTTILNVTPKPYLTKWRGDIGNKAADEYMNDAADFGSAVHRACEILASGGIVVYVAPNKPNFSIIELKEKYKNENIHILFDQYQYLQVYRFQKFLNEVKPNVISTEQILFNLQYEYAGTMDLELDIYNEDEKADYNINGTKPLTLENGTYIADIKSGKSIYSDHFMQIAAYMKAYKKLKPNKKLKGGLIIHTNAQTKTGIEGLSIKLITLEEAEKYFNDFLKIYEVWKINPSPSKPKFFDLPSCLQYNQ